MANLGEKLEDPAPLVFVQLFEAIIDYKLHIQVQLATALTGLDQAFGEIFAADFRQLGRQPG